MASLVLPVHVLLARELVADSPHGNNVGRLFGLILYFFPQMTNMYVNRFFVTDKVVIIPYLAGGRRLASKNTMPRWRAKKASNSNSVAVSSILLSSL